jgi:hypothetical protein
MQLNGWATSMELDKLGKVLYLSLEKHCYAPLFIRYFPDFGALVFSNDTPRCFPLTEIVDVHVEIMTI